MTRLKEESYKGALAFQVIEEESTKQIVSISRLTTWQQKRWGTLVVEIRDALTQFQESGIDNADDVISDGAGKWNDRRLKDLARMTLAFLRIAAMSTELERVFSGVKFTISDC